MRGRNSQTETVPTRSKYLTFFIGVLPVDAGLGLVFLIGGCGHHNRRFAAGAFGPGFASPYDTLYRNLKLLRISAPLAGFNLRRRADLRK